MKHTKAYWYAIIAGFLLWAVFVFISGISWPAALAFMACVLVEQHIGRILEREEMIKENEQIHQEKL